MAKAKFEKLNTNQETNPSKTHKDLQKKPGRPVGSKTKKEPANATLSISLTPSQKKELEEYAKNELRSSSSVVKVLLIKNGIISYSE
jgi:hypothetical protein